MVHGLFKMCVEWGNFVEQQKALKKKEIKKNKGSLTHNQGLYRVHNNGKLVLRRFLLLRCVSSKQSNSFQLQPLFNNQPEYDEYDCAVIYFEVPECD